MSDFITLRPNTPLLVPIADYPTTGDMVLDPVCGSGGIGHAALRLGRRCIVIDRSPDAINVTWERLTRASEAGEFPAVVQRCEHGGRVNAWSMVHRVEFRDDDAIPWDNGDSYVVLGDALEVMRSMPDSFVALVYADPPYGTQKTFTGKAGSFDDTWHWDDVAESRLAELAEMADGRIGNDAADRDWLIDWLTLMRRSEKDSKTSMTAYLVWVALLMVECRRVMGSTSYELAYPALTKAGFVV